MKCFKIFHRTNKDKQEFCKNEARTPLSPLLFSIVLEVLDKATKQKRKGGKSHTDNKGRNKTPYLQIT